MTSEKTKELLKFIMSNKELNDIDDDEKIDVDDDDYYLSPEEIKDIWGVDFGDPDLDVDDIAGDR
jgi:hypothetical protein